MPRFRRRGSSGDRLEASSIDAYQPGGGRYVRKPVNADHDDIPTGQQAKVQVLPKDRDDPSHPYYRLEELTHQSLTRTRDQLLGETAGQDKGQATPRLQERSVGQGNPAQAFIRFQDQLREIRADANSIANVFGTFGRSSLVLCKQPSGRATLVWLGAEFAENILSRIHADDKKNSNGEQSEKAASEMFAGEAAQLLSAGKLTQGGFDALMAGFAAGMRGQSGAEVMRTVISPQGETREVSRLALAPAHHADAVRRGLDSVLSTANKPPNVEATRQALNAAKKIQTLPELIGHLGPGSAKRRTERKAPESRTDVDHKHNQGIGPSTGQTNAPVIDKQPADRPESKQALTDHPKERSGQDRGRDDQARVAALERELTDTRKEVAALREQLDSARASKHTDTPPVDRQGHQDGTAKRLQDLAVQVQHLEEEIARLRDRPSDERESRRDGGKPEAGPVRGAMNVSTQTGDIANEESDPVVQEDVPPAASGELFAGLARTDSTSDNKHTVIDREVPVAPVRGSPEPLASNRTASGNQASSTYEQTGNPFLGNAPDQPNLTSALPLVSNPFDEEFDPLLNGDVPSTVQGNPFADLDRASIPPDRKTAAPRTRPLTTGPAPTSILGKRQRSDATDDTTEPDRSRQNPAQMREVAAANNEPPTEPAIPQRDPGVAAQANAGPPPDEQPLPVNEPAQVAPLVGDQQVQENAVPDLQPVAAGSNAGAGITLPRVVHADPDRADSGTGGSARDNKTAQPHTSTLDSDEAPGVPQPDGDSESPVNEDESLIPPGQDFERQPRTSPATPEPPLTIVGGRRPARITDSPPISLSTSTSVTADITTEESGPALGLQISEAIEGITQSMLGQLSPLARSLGSVLVRHGNVDPETVQTAITTLLDTASEIESALQQVLEEAMAPMPLSPSEKLGLRKKFGDKVSTLQRDLFQAAFSVPQSDAPGRLRFASRLIALSEGQQDSQAGGRTARFAEDMLADLEENSSRLGASLWHWRPQLDEARKAAERAREARSILPGLSALLPSQGDLVYDARVGGELFAAKVNHRGLTAREAERALFDQLRKAELSRADRTAEISRRMPRLDAKADGTLQARWAKREAEFQKELDAIEDAAIEAEVAAICDTLEKTPLEVRTTFARAVLRLRERSTALDGAAAAYVKALVRGINQHANDIRHPWAIAIKAARSADTKGAAPQDDDEPVDEAEEEEEGSGEVIPIGSAESMVEADEVQGGDDLDGLDGIDEVDGMDGSGDKEDAEKAEPVEIVQARTKSQGFMASLEGQPAPAKARAIAAFLDKNFNSDPVGAGEGSDDFIPGPDPDVLQALRQPIIDRLDTAVAASLLSHFALEIVTDPSATAQEAFHLVARHIVTPEASQEEVDAARKAIMDRIEVPFDRNSHAEAAAAMVDGIAHQLSISIILAKGQRDARRSLVPGQPGTTPPPAPEHAEAETRVLATPVPPTQPQAAMGRPEPSQAPTRRQVTSDLPVQVGAVARAAIELEGALQALPLRAADWPDRMATICYGLDIVRDRADHAASIANDTQGKAITSMSSSTAGGHLGRLLGLNDGSRPVDQDHLTAMFKGLVNHARNPADLAGLVGGLLATTHPWHVQAIGSSAAAVIELPESAFTLQLTSDPRTNALQLLTSLATIRSTAPAIAALAQGDARLRIDGQPDSKGSSSQALASTPQDEEREEAGLLAELSRIEEAQDLQAELDGINEEIAARERPMLEAFAELMRLTNEPGWIGSERLPDLLDKSFDHPEIDHAIVKKFQDLLEADSTLSKRARRMLELNLSFVRKRLRMSR